MKGRGILSYPVLLILLLVSLPATGQHLLDSLRAVYVNAVPVLNRYVVNQGTAHALFDNFGNPLTPFVYREIKAALDRNFLAIDGSERAAILDSNGNVVYIFQHRINSVDTFHRLYKCQNCHGDYHYAENDKGELIFRNANTQDYLKGMMSYRGSAFYHELSKAGVIDTNGKILLPPVYDYVVVDTQFIAAFRDDSVFVFDRQLKLQYISPGQRVENLSGLVVITLYGICGIKDVHGNTLLPFSIAPEKREEAARAIRLGGKQNEVKNSLHGYSYIETLPTGWTICHVEGGSNVEIRDKSFTVVIKGGEYENARQLGDKYIALYKDYFDEEAVVYDCVKRRFSDLKIVSHVAKDGYVAIDGKTNRKILLKGDKHVKLPPFTEIDGDRHRPLFQVNNGPENDQRRYGSRIDETVLPRKPILYGLLDSEMHVILPMAYDNISRLSDSLFFAQSSSDETTSVFHLNGKLIYKRKGRIKLTQEPGYIRITDSVESLLIKSNGEIVYRGNEFVTPLYFYNGQNTTKLYLREDTSGNSAIMTQTGQQLLPYLYHQVSPKAPGLVTLKRGDSLYFLNEHGRLLYNGKGMSTYNYFILHSFRALVKNSFGKWAIIDPWGHILEPYVYDTAGYLEKMGYFLGRNGTYTVLDNAGGIIYRGDTLIHANDADFGYFLYANRQFYKAVNGELIPVDVRAVPHRRGEPRDGFIISRGHINTKGNSEPRDTLFNSKGIRLGVANGHYGHRIFYNKAVIDDSATNRIAVIDTTGNFIIPFVPKPKFIILNLNNVALAYGGPNDIMYREENGRWLKEQVEIDTNSEREISTHIAANVGSGHYLFTSKTIRRGIGSHYSYLRDESIDEIKYKHYQYQVRINDKWGVWNWYLKNVVPVECDSIDAHRENIWDLTAGGKKGVYNLNPSIYLRPQYDQIYYPASITNGFIVVQSNGRFTIVNKRGEAIVQDFDSIGNLSPWITQLLAFNNSTVAALVINDDGTIKVMDSTGAPITKRGIWQNMHGMVITRENGKEGLYSNATYQTKLPTEYDRIQYEKGMFTAWKYKTDKHDGIDSTIVTDQNGKVIFRSKGWHVYKRIADTIWLVSDTTIRIIGSSGKQIVGPGYYYSLYNQDYEQFPGILFMTREKKEGIMDVTGKVTTPFIFDNISATSYANNLPERYYEGYVRRNHGLKYGIINSKGYLLSDSLYDGISEAPTHKYFKEVLFLVEQDEKVGLMDDGGRLVLPCVYDSLQQVYGENLAIVKKDKWGIISLKGKVIVPFKYDYLGPLIDDRIEFSLGSSTGFLDRRGRIIK